MELITDVKKLESAVKACVTGANKLQNQIHLVACSTLAHAEQHGDFGAFARLIYGLPSGQRVKTVRKWARMFAPVKFVDGEKIVKLDRSEKAPAFDIDGAIANPYYAIEEVTTSKPLTMQEVLDYLNRKAKAKETDTADVLETRKAIGRIAAYAQTLASPLAAPADDVGSFPAERDLRQAA